MENQSLELIVDILKNLSFQMQSINDHLSWLAHKEKQSLLTPEGHAIKCEKCQEIYKHSVVFNAEDMMRGICAKCNNLVYNDMYKIRIDNNTVCDAEKQLHDKGYYGKP